MNSEGEHACAHGERRTVTVINQGVMPMVCVYFMCMCMGVYTGASACIASGLRQLVTVLRSVSSWECPKSWF